MYNPTVTSTYKSPHGYYSNIDSLLLDKLKSVSNILTIHFFNLKGNTLDIRSCIMVSSEK